MLPRTCHTRWLLALLLLAAPSACLADNGINLAWSHCWGEGTGATNRVFPCASNTGSNLITGSFVMSTNMPKVIGTEIILQLASDSPALPEWWKFKNVGSCRQSSMNANFIADPTDVVCVDWAEGGAVGGIGAYCTLSNPCAPSAPTVANVAVIRMINAVPQEAAKDLAGNTEYFDFNILINNAKTVGTGSCGGCSVPVCIVLNSINVVDLGNQSPRRLTNPSVPGSNYVTWQGGGAPHTPNGTGCPAATPTRQSTWGSVKSLYR